MTEDQVTRLLGPVTLDKGIEYWGGTGARTVHYQVSPNQEVVVDFPPHSPFNAIILGMAPKPPWVRHGGGSITVPECPGVSGPATQPASGRVTRPLADATNWARLRPMAAPTDKAFEKFSAEELMRYVMPGKLPGGSGLEYPDSQRLACAWFCWKTRGTRGGEPRAMLAAKIYKMLDEAWRDPEQSSHTLSLYAGFLGPLGAQRHIRELLGRIQRMDCCYGPALVGGLAECGDIRDVPFLIEQIDKETEACAPVVNEALNTLTGQSIQAIGGLATDKAAWQKWWQANRTSPSMPAEDAP